MSTLCPDECLPRLLTPAPTSRFAAGLRNHSMLQGGQETGFELANSCRKHTAFGQPALASGIFNQYPETIPAVLSSTAFIWSADAV
jgi:hypothetical protein